MRTCWSADVRMLKLVKCGRFLRMKSADVTGKMRRCGLRSCGFLKSIILNIDRRSDLRRKWLISDRASLSTRVHLLSGSRLILTYLPHPNPYFALGSHLNRQWFPLHSYKPFITHPFPKKITCIYNTMLNFISVSFCTAYIIVTFRVGLGLGSVLGLRLRLGLNFISGPVS